MTETTDPKSLIVQPYAREGLLGGVRFGLDIQLSCGGQDKRGPGRLKAIRDWCEASGHKFRLSHAQDQSDCGVEWQSRAARDALLKVLPGLIGDIECRRARTRQAEGWLGGDLDLIVRLHKGQEGDETGQQTDRIEIALEDTVSSPARASFFQKLVAACKTHGIDLTRTGRRSATLAAEDGKIPAKLARWLTDTKIARSLPDQSGDTKDASAKTHDPKDTPPPAQRRHEMTTPALPTVTWTAREYRGALGGESHCIELYVGVGEPEEELTRRKKALAAWLSHKGIGVMGDVEGMDGPLSVFNLARREDVDSMTKALPEVFGLSAQEVNGAYDSPQTYPGHLDVPLGMTMVAENNLKLRNAKGIGMVIGLPREIPAQARKATIARLVQQTGAGTHYHVPEDFRAVRLVFHSVESRQKYADAALPLLHKLDRAVKATPPTP
ncbi:MAG: hypothetical protein Alpg2KO_26820 [Alphaproteobacteria bacterium]